VKSGSRPVYRCSVWHVIVFGVVLNACNITVSELGGLLRTGLSRSQLKGA